MPESENELHDKFYTVKSQAVDWSTALDFTVCFLDCLPSNVGLGMPIPTYIVCGTDIPDFLHFYGLFYAPLSKSINEKVV